MIGIGEKFPDFNKKTVVSIEPGEEFARLNSGDLFNGNGKWTVFFWWPKDFTFVCPTEIAGFNHASDDFEDANARLIGASTDSEFVHLAWREHHPDLRNLRFPMLADTSKSLAEELGILSKDEKVAYRATFIIDPEGIIRWVQVNDLGVGRSIDEVLRVLKALQTDELTPCNWNPGEKTLG